MVGSGVDHLPRGTERANGRIVALRTGQWVVLDTAGPAGRARSTKAPGDQHAPVAQQCPGGLEAGSGHRAGQGPGIRCGMVDLGT